MFRSQSLTPTEVNLPARFARALGAQKGRYDQGLESVVAGGIRRGVFRDAPARLVIWTRRQRFWPSSGRFIPAFCEQLAVGDMPW